MLDADRLLEPIPEGSPCGVDLRVESADSTFADVQEFRRESEPDDFTGDPGKEAEFGEIFKICEAALAHRTKDLELAVSLVEAAARLEGLSSLREGLRLIRELLTRYWAEVHPGVDPQDGSLFLGVRRRHLEWLGGGSDKARISLLEVPVLWVDEKTPLSWAMRRQAERVDATALEAPERHAELIADGAITGEVWQGQVSRVPPEQLRESLEAARGASSELSALGQTCQELFGDDEPPSFQWLEGLLEEVSLDLERLCGVDSAAESASAGAESGAAGVATRPAGAAGGPIQTRADALHRLKEVASWFRQVEPHSPIAPLVLRAVRWGEMPLEQVLREVVKDEAVLDQIWDTLGIAGGSATRESE